jgi:uncharacterized membrane protein
MEPLETTAPVDKPFTGAEIGAIAHLYRGEVYRSTVWRTRLDNTTNWAVAGLGIALSVTFSNKEASALPLLLMGALIVVFLIFEARRYRYFNVWRARARWIETHFYARLLLHETPASSFKWEGVLAGDYCAPQYHISFARAVGRRLRRNYGYVLAIQALAYVGKIAIHPTAVTSFGEFVERASIGPIPGAVILLGGALFNCGWIIFALVTYRLDREKHEGQRVSMG